MLDSVVDEFHFWCDLRCRKLLVEATEGTLRLQNYQSVESDMQYYFGPEVGHLWRYILNGRAVGRAETSFPYTSANEGFPNSFWTYDEVGFLCHGMMSYKEDFDNLFGLEDETVAAAFEAIQNVYEKEVGLIIEVA